VDNMLLLLVFIAELEKHNYLFSFFSSLNHLKVLYF
jgi:hypothetical protein